MSVIPSIVDKALRFAIDKHELQYRKGMWKIPYAVHVVDVMKRTAKFTMDEQVLAAALLHDYIEDCNLELTHEQKYIKLKNEFTSRIADIVMECTRVAGDDIPQEEKVAFLNTFKEKSFNSVLIKVADRYSNCMDYVAEGRWGKAHDYFWEAEQLLERFHKDADAEQHKYEAIMYDDLRRAIAWHKAQERFNNAPL
jgi:myo-inositol-1(or 4)-monophosphatase